MNSGFSWSHDVKMVLYQIKLIISFSLLYAGDNSISVEETITAVTFADLAISFTRAVLRGFKISRVSEPLIFHVSLSPLRVRKPAAPAFYVDLIFYVSLSPLRVRKPVALLFTWIYYFTCL